MPKIIRCYKPQGEHEDIEQALTIEDLQKRLQGYVEVRNMGFVCVACDEEGRIKNLPFCRSINHQVFVGDLYVGKLTAKGLSPVDTKLIEKFEAFCVT